MSIEITDSTFGLLTQDENCDWEFEYSSDYLGKKILITIEGSNANLGDTPEPEVYKSFSWFNSNQFEIKKIVEKGIFEHYQKYYDQYRKGWGSEAEKRVPSITKEHDIWALIQEPTIWFHCDYCDFSIHWGAIWDPEHGITVSFKNGQIIDVE